MLFFKSPMTVIEIQCDDPEYTVETHRAEATLSCGAITATTGWFGSSDWKRGIDIIVIDPITQNLPSLDR